MAKVKKIASDWSETSLTVYCIIMRKLDNYLFSDVEGAFEAAPADPYISMTENSTVKGRYELSESRAIFNDGWYRVFVYKQSGGSPAPASDNLIGSGDMFIESDIETFINSKMNNAMVRAIGQDTLGVTKIVNSVGDLSLPDDVGDTINNIDAQTSRIRFDASDAVITSNPFQEGVVVSDSGNSHIQMKTDLDETVDDYWVGGYVKFVSGALDGQVKKILTYDGTDKILTFYAAFTSTPQTGAQFKIINE